MQQASRVSGIGEVRPAQPAKRNLGRFSVLAGALSLLLASAAQAQFATPGQFDVSPTGAASYTIPIAVPPGTAGMAPSLALNYNSQGGNGLLGMGWGLSGLSAITRCPKTLVQDAIKDGITYTNTDKYCLDGQRLVVSNGGVYGANGTEYRTERDGFSKIISYGTVGTTGSAWFKVWTKSGQILEFGNTTNSAIEAQGKTAIRVWAVNKVSDTKGNYLTVTYTEDNPNGQYYPSRIDYTGNTAGSLAPYNSVRFTYVDRPDQDEISPFYVKGSVTKLTKRMTNIKTYAKVNNVDTLVKDYRLAYDDTAISKASLLSTLTECDGSASPVCLPATTLTWQKATGGATYGAPQTISAGWYGDVNGDGVTDRIYTSTAPYGYYSTSYTGTLYVALSGVGGTAWGTYTVNCVYDNDSISYICPALQGMLGDMNGDGKQDLVTTNEAGSTKVRLSTGTAFGAAANWGAAPRMIGDVNGDGKDDFVWLPTGSTINCNYLTTIQQPVSVGISTGTGLMATATWGNFTAACKWDGYDYMYNPSRMFGALGDVNADGRMDLIFTANATGLVAYSTGSTFTMPTAAAPSWNSVQVAHPPIWVSDVNGDGLDDLISTSSAGDTDTGWTINIKAAFANGNGFSAAVDWFSFTATCGLPSCLNPILEFADLNNDGKVDMISASTKAHMTQFYAPDVVTKVTNGLGATTTLTYKALSDTATYTPESGSLFPLRAVGSQVGFYVVSSVSSSNGIGGNYVSNYSYVGAKSHVTGGGFLGFRQTVSTDAQTGIKSTTTYRQDYPYQGLPLSAEKRTSTNVLLNKVANTWAFDTNAAWSAQYHAPELTQSIESSYELTGALISTVTTCTKYEDGYGNPTYIGVWTTTTAAGINCAAPPAKTGYYVKETTNIYTNDIVRWYLGRLTKATVESTTP